MGFLTNPSIDQVNPNTPQAQQVQGGMASFLQDLFQNPGQSPFAGQTSDLQRGATNSLMQFLSANPEQQTFDALQPGLMEMFQGGQADMMSQAALPVFESQLQRTLGGLASGAPGRFGTAFASQGVDFASRAAQDFALLQQQARMQEMQNQMGAAGLLGQLAGQAGQGAFGRSLGAAQLGTQQTQAAIDPVLQLMLGGMNAFRPAQMDTVVGSSPLDKIINGGLAALTASQFGGGGGSAIQQAIGAGLNVQPSRIQEPDPFLVMLQNRMGGGS